MKKKEYIEYFPKALLEDIIAGKCLPFIGAGFSLNADSKDKNCRAMTWNELGVFFRKELLPIGKKLTKDQQAQTNGLEYITVYEERTNRIKLAEKMREALCIDKMEVGATHKAFCSIPFNLVCTTNFDSLLEEGFKAAGKTSFTKINETQLPFTCAKEMVEILKIHGDINHPETMIATESDYDGYIKNHPLMVTYLTNLLITKTPLFVGYSLDDSDFRQIYKMVTDRLGSMTNTPYTIQFQCSDEDKQRYARRGVTVIDLPKIGKRTYKETLTKAFEEVGRYCSEESLKNVTDREVAWQVLLPDGMSNNICLFVFSKKDISYYRDVIYPIVRSVGLYPISSYDGLFLESNFFSGFYQLMDKASVVCYEEDGGIDNDMWNQLIINKDKKILVGFTSMGKCKHITGPMFSIKKPIADSEDYENEVSIVKDTFMKISTQCNTADDDVKKLIGLKMYSEAYLKCYMIMEKEIRKKYDNLQTQRGITYFLLSDKFSPFFKIKDRQAIAEYSRKRNSLAHGEEVLITKYDIDKAKRINSIILNAIKNDVDKDVSL